MYQLKSQYYGTGLPNEITANVYDALESNIQIKYQLLTYSQTGLSNDDYEPYTPTLTGNILGDMMSDNSDFTIPDTAPDPPQFDGFGGGDFGGGGSGGDW